MGCIRHFSYLQLVVLNHYFIIQTLTYSAQKHVSDNSCVIGFVGI